MARHGDGAPGGSSAISEGQEARSQFARGEGLAPTAPQNANGPGPDVADWFGRRGARGGWHLAGSMGLLRARPARAFRRESLQLCARAA